MTDQTIFIVASSNFILNSSNQQSYHVQGYFESPVLAKSLKEQYKILAEPIGSFCHFTQQKQVKGPPFQLDKYSLAFLIKNHKEQFVFEGIQSFSLEKITNEDSYIVFETLINKGYFLISAKKFGANFLAYDSDPSMNHAKYLVFLSNDQTVSNKEISCKETENLIYINRLATIAKKEAILAKLVLVSYSDAKEDDSEHSNIISDKQVQLTKMQRLQHY